MNKEVANIVFHMTKRKQIKEIEVPLFITANDLVVALNEAYALKIDISDVKKCYLKAEKPIAFLKGNKTLAEFGIRNGSVIYFTE